MLINLPGCAGSKHSVFAQSANAVKTALQSGAAALTAGPAGCAMVWRDDAKKLHGSYQVRMQTCEEREFRNIKESVEWFMVWYGKLHVEAAAVGSY